MKILSILLLVLMANMVNAQTIKNETTMDKQSGTLNCKLTTPELKARKQTVIAELKKLLIERIETDNGMRYKFDGSDKIIDLVTNFVKTERLCCDFFDFTVSVTSESIWLELSGPKGTKEFIKEEIDF